jgi:hypothetical protein
MGVIQNKQRNLSMKIFISLLLLFSLSGPLHAATYNGQGTIHTIHISDSRLGREGVWIKVNGFDSAGSCGKSGDGLVWMLAKQDENGKAQYSLAVAAHMAGLQVNVGVDDDYKGSENICHLRTIYLTK